MCFPVKFAKFLRAPFFNRAPPLAASVDSIQFLANVPILYSLKTPENF